MCFHNDFWQGIYFCNLYCPISNRIKMRAEKRKKELVTKKLWVQFFVSYFSCIQQHHKSQIWKNGEHNISQIIFRELRRGVWLFISFSLTLNPFFAPPFPFPQFFFNFFPLKFFFSLQPACFPLTCRQPAFPLPHCSPPQKNPHPW